MPRSGNKKRWKSAGKSDRDADNPKRPLSSAGKPVVREYSPQVHQEVEALFGKRFAFEKPTGEGAAWVLPSADSLFRTPVVKVGVQFAV